MGGLARRVGYVTALTNLTNGKVPILQVDAGHPPDRLPGERLRLAGRPRCQGQGLRGSSGLGKGGYLPVLGRREDVRPALVSPDGDGQRCRQAEQARGSPISRCASPRRGS